MQSRGDSNKVGPTEERISEKSVKNVQSNIKTIWRKKNRKTYGKQFTLPTRSLASIIIDETYSQISSDDDFEQAVNQAERSNKVPPKAVCSEYL